MTRECGATESGTHRADTQTVRPRLGDWLRARRNDARKDNERVVLVLDIFFFFFSARFIFCSSSSPTPFLLVECGRRHECDSRNFERFLCSFTTPHACTRVMQTQSHPTSSAAVVLKTEPGDGERSVPVIDNSVRATTTPKLCAPESACEPHIYELFMRLNRDEKVNQETNKASE